jgi:hypothetical protein
VAWLAAGEVRAAELLTRSMNIESTRRGGQTEPWLTTVLPARNQQAMQRRPRSLGPTSDGLENGLFAHTGAGYDNPQLWTSPLPAGQHIEQVVAPNGRPAAPNQCSAAYRRQAMKQKSARDPAPNRTGHNPRKVGLYPGNTDERPLHQSSFHSFPWRIFLP